jgi:putative transposase
MKQGIRKGGRKQGAWLEGGLQQEVEIPGGKLLVQSRAELLETVMTSGAQVMTAMLLQDVEALCGGSHHRHSDGTASRWGWTGGEVVMGGRKLAIRRPRVRQGKQELTLPCYEHWQGQDPLRRRVLEQVLVGVSNRHYHRSLEAAPVATKSRGTSRSAVNRQFVALTTEKLTAWLNRPLTDEYLALFIDGIGLGEHTIIAAVGVTSTGNKQVLGAWEGATENAVVCQMLLDNLRERGFRTDQQLLVVLDGAKALRKAVQDTFGERAIVQRCQEHKKRNVKSQLPKGMQTSTGMAMQQAYNCGDYTRAKQLLNNLAQRLDRDCPGAAASLREGLEETLTVLRLELSRPLRQSLGNTNIIESTIDTVKKVSRRVKRWKGGAMALRWAVTGLGEAERQFRRLRGYRELAILAQKLGRNQATDAAVKVA